MYQLISICINFLQLPQQSYDQLGGLKQKFILLQFWRPEE